MKKIKLILLVILLLSAIIFFSPWPYLSYQETGCEDNRPDVVCTRFKRTINFSSSFFQKIIINIKTKKYPQYGYAPDFSWVAGKVEYRNLEGGCFILNFDKKPPSLEGSSLPFHGLLALGNQQGPRFDLQPNSYVIIFGKLGESKFSMSCPPQNYIIEKVSNSHYGNIFK